MIRTIGGMVVATTLVACGPGYQKLEVDKIQSVALVIDDPEQRFCAYAPVPLRAVVTYNDGKQARSKAPTDGAKGHLRTSEFAWSASHGTVDDLAVLALPPDPLLWFDAAVQVSARVVARPELGAEAIVNPRFDCGGTVDLRGAVGSRGGEDEDGGAGAPGPEIDVAVGYADTTRHGRLVLVRVQRDDAPVEHFLVTAGAARKPFVLDVRGGDGGEGGQGVEGFHGRPGAAGDDGVDGVGCADGTAGGSGGPGEPAGPGGPAANGGAGGHGGDVTVRYDSRFAELPDRVQVLVDGGAAGAAGAGGLGGRGGHGGAGGKGGKAGTANDPSCPAKDGVAGPQGAYGGDGAVGAAGMAGSAGAPGRVQRVPVEVGMLFAEEIARGLPIVTAGGGS